MTSFIALLWIIHMTFIAVVSMQDCVVLAADREEFTVYGDGQSVKSGATARKITKLSDAYITASGWKDLINPVKERLVSEESSDIDRIMAIVEEEQNLFRSRAPSLAREWIPKSSWKMTLPWGERVIAAIYDPSKNAFLGVDPGVSVFTYPPEVTAAEMAHVEGLFPVGDFLSVTQVDLARVVDRILMAVAFLRSRGRPVSREIDFIIHCVSGRTEFERVAAL